MTEESMAVRLTKAAFEASCGKPFYTTGSTGHIWFNGHICLAKDMVFGVSVYANEGSYYPLSMLNGEELIMVRDLVNKSTSPVECPYLEEINLLIAGT